MLQSSKLSKEVYANSDGICNVDGRLNVGLRESESNV